MGIQCKPIGKVKSNMVKMEKSLVKDTKKPKHKGGKKSE